MRSADDKRDERHRTSEMGRVTFVLNDGESFQAEKIRRPGFGIPVRHNIHR